MMDSYDKDFKIEVCVDSIESSLAAIQGGANRLEICGNLALGGGTTPSIGLVHLIKQVCPNNIDLMIMIRPRVGDFLYSELEIEVMKTDIRNFATVGVTGVVLGVLCADGTIDAQRTRILVNTSTDLGLQGSHQFHLYTSNFNRICFHRAFDMTVDQRQALQVLLNIRGITRILTSGGVPFAPSDKGISSLSDLLEFISSTSSTPARSEGLGSSTFPTKKDGQCPLEIMPGSGINGQSASGLLRALLPLGIRSLHLSGGRFINCAMSDDGFLEDYISEKKISDDRTGENITQMVTKGMLYRPMDMGMGAGGERDWQVWRTNAASVQAVRRVVDQEWATFIDSKT